MAAQQRRRLRRRDGRCDLHAYVDMCGSPISARKSLSFPSLALFGRSAVRPFGQNAAVAAAGRRSARIVEVPDRENVPYQIDDVAVPEVVERVGRQRFANACDQFVVTGRALARNGRRRSGEGSAC